VRTAQTRFNDGVEASKGEQIVRGDHSREIPARNLEDASQRFLSGFLGEGLRIHHHAAIDAESRLAHGREERAVACVPGRRRLRTADEGNLPMSKLDEMLAWQPNAGFIIRCDGSDPRCVSHAIDENQRNPVLDAFLDDRIFTERGGKDKAVHLAREELSDDRLSGVNVVVESASITT